MKLLALAMITLAAHAAEPRCSKAVVQTSLVNNQQWTYVDNHDGDTILFEHPATHCRVLVRLYGIDAPEIGQPFGVQSRDHVHQAFVGTSVVASFALPGKSKKPQYSYNRPVLIVVVHRRMSVNEMATLTLNEHAVRRGWAWHEPRYAKRDKALIDAQASAKRHGLGLWALPEPVEPWLWRKGSR